jgi:hypothetical protein
MKLSTTLIERGQETEREIATLEARLTSILSEKTGVLGAAVIDTKVLARLEQEEASVPLKIASLHTRLSLLAVQVEQAEKEEAVSRVAAIERELAHLTPTLQSQHDAWREGVAKLAALLEQNGHDQARAKTLREEGAYLVERFNAPWPHGSPVPFPSRADLSKIEEQFRRKVWDTFGGSQWQQKTDELRKAKNAAAQREAEERRTHGRARGMVRMSTPAFTIGKQA